MTTTGLETVGERISIDSDLPWVSDLIEEGANGELGTCSSLPSVRVVIEAPKEPFGRDGLEVVTRGTWGRRDEIVVTNVCSAGFDLHLRCSSDLAEFTYRWRPPARDRAAARVLRSRFHLLARAALVQYPALWWAGTKGRVPLHASACATGRATPLLSAAGGVGRSTLLLAEVARGALITGDNLAVGDGTGVWGLVEPLRVEGGGGRPMPHGRTETVLADRARSLTPDSLVVLERGASEGSSLAPCAPEQAARALALSTYMAGELRRYWPFAATLTAGTGRGPAHPPVVDVAAGFAARLPCYRLGLGSGVTAPLSHLLAELSVAA